MFHIILLFGLSKIPEGIQRIHLRCSSDHILSFPPRIQCKQDSLYCSIGPLDKSYNIESKYKRYCHRYQWLKSIRCG